MDIGLEEINEWHKERGFKDDNGDRIFCGYHYVIRRSGIYEIGRPINRVGAHVRGHNYDSIGICFAGRDSLSKRQDESLMHLLYALCMRHGLNSRDVWGHYEFDEHKTCPNLDMEKLRDRLKRNLGG